MFLLPAMVAYCSVALDKPVQPQMCVLGSMSIGGTINKVEELAPHFKWHLMQERNEF
jgi:predicted ATP-dependent Lon-type protease